MYQRNASECSIFNFDLFLLNPVYFQLPDQGNQRVPIHFTVKVQVQSKTHNNKIKYTKPRKIKEQCKDSW